MKKQEVQREVDIASKRSHDKLMEEFCDIKSSMSDVLERLAKIQKTLGAENEPTSTTICVGVEGGSGVDPIPTSASSPKSIADMELPAANHKAFAAGTTKPNNPQQFLKAAEEEGPANDEGNNDTIVEVADDEVAMALTAEDHVTMT